MTDELSGFIRSQMAAAYEDTGDDGAAGEPLDERPDDISENAWARLSDDQRAELLAIRADDDEGYDDEEAAPLAGNELNEAIHGMVVGLLEGEGEAAWRAAGYDPEQVVIEMTTMSSAEWSSFCEDTRWDPAIRPSYSSLPVELQVRHHREVLERKMTDLAASGRHLESGTSR